MHIFILTQYSKLHGKVNLAAYSNMEEAQDTAWQRTLREHKLRKLGFSNHYTYSVEPITLDEILEIQGDYNE